MSLVACRDNATVMAGIINFATLELRNGNIVSGDAAQGTAIT
jgi:hypothetical protein